MASCTADLTAALRVAGLGLRPVVVAVDRDSLRYDADVVGAAGSAMPTGGSANTTATGQPA